MNVITKICRYSLKIIDPVDVAELLISENYLQYIKSTTTEFHRSIIVGKIQRDSKIAFNIELLSWKEELPLLNSNYGLTL